MSKRELCECLSNAPLHASIVERTVAVLRQLPVGVGNNPRRHNDRHIHPTIEQLQQLITEAGVCYLVDGHLHRWGGRERIAVCFFATQEANYLSHYSI